MQLAYVLSFFLFLFFIEKHLFLKLLNLNLILLFIIVDRGVIRLLERLGSSCLCGTYALGSNEVPLLVDEVYLFEVG